MYVMIRKKAL